MYICIYDNLWVGKDVHNRADGRSFNKLFHELYRMFRRLIILLWNSQSLIKNIAHKSSTTQPHRMFKNSLIAFLLRYQLSQDVCCAPHLVSRLSSPGEVYFLSQQANTAESTR